MVDSCLNNLLVLFGIKCCTEHGTLAVGRFVRTYVGKSSRTSARTSNLIYCFKGAISSHKGKQVC